jgi:hypothetical protein
MARRNHLEGKLGMTIAAPHKAQARKTGGIENRVPLSIRDGVVIVGSDAHYWPGEISTAHRGLVRISKDLGEDVKAVIMNGDVADFPKIGRHPPIGWEKPPDVEDEMDAIDQRLTEIRAAAPKARHLWTRGNHDSRFETA